MSTRSEIPVKPSFSGEPFGRQFLKLPTTRLGVWSVALGAAFLVLFVLNVTVFAPAADASATGIAPWRQALLPFFGIGVLLCGLASGFVGLITLLRHGERSWLVWLTLLPGLMMIIFMLGEFFLPH